MTHISAPKDTLAIEKSRQRLAAARAHYEAGKLIRKEEAKAARRAGAKYREIAEALDLSVNRAYTLVNEDTSAALEAAE